MNGMISVSVDVTLRQGMNIFAREIFGQIFSESEGMFLSPREIERRGDGIRLPRSRKRSIGDFLLREKEFYEKIEKAW
ncbi:MAG: hypothetical protein IKA76_09575, partial [Clostridia bacterium]|nr:hypothetical protein [Clostridia bacterium]